MMRFDGSPQLQSLLLITAIVVGRSHFTTVARSINNDGALYLTPMICDGKMDEARAASEVKHMKDGIESYSGYLTVDHALRSNLFFWFFPAVCGADTAPVLLWLQGGPGASSLYAVFNEHGPFSVTQNHVLKLRNHTWTATHSVLYVDNPVGTGFSFTGDDAGYNTDQMAVGHNMYEALTQFFTLFSEYRKNDFYVTGESYAGKYVPSVSYAIHQKNPGAPNKINLKGLIIGNGLVDPIKQLIYSDYLYELGFVDENGKSAISKAEKIAHSQIENGDFSAAFQSFDELLTGDIYRYPTLFHNLTGMSYYFNILSDKNPNPSREWRTYVQKPSMRARLHVGQRPLNDGSKVEKHLLNDVMQSVSPLLGTLLDAGQYRVLFYTGQLDIIVPYLSTMRMAQAIKWSGAEQFKNAKRTIWLVPHEDDEKTADMAGYATSFGPLTVVLVRNAGHMVPIDQPIWCLDLINRFTRGKLFTA